MKITKVINNNLVRSINEKNQEIIVMGKGIGFQKKVGEEIDQNHISQIYISDDRNYSNKLTQILEKVPLNIIQLTNEIVQYAKVSLARKLNENIYLTLTDHISFAIQRQKENVPLKNALLWEIKRFYNHEFLIGKEALSMIKNKLGIELSDDEAGFIALHFVNATMDSIGIEQTALLAKTVQDILNIVKYHFSINLNEESVYYERFITHLKFFVARILSDTEMVNDDLGFMLELKQKYKEEYLCSLKINSFIEHQFNKKLTENEMIYLTIHIRRVIQN